MAGVIFRPFRHLWLPVLIFLILGVYSWIFAQGMKENLPVMVDYYDQLATSFLHGQLALETKPEAALLAVPDPYDFKSRSQIQYPWDVSLYNGRFYLYWEPVPALALIPIKLFFHGGIGDYDIVLAAISGLLILNLSFLTRLWKNSFNTLPGWTLCLGILLAGFALPLPWMLARPAIYEASIAGGQFFLIAGIYGIYSAFSGKETSIWKLAIGGSCFSLAIGSRVTLVFPVIFLVLLTGFWLFWRGREQPASRKRLFGLVALGLPLLLGGIALGWYNWARFGSVSEFGYRYQLTGRNLDKLSSLTFLPTYLPTNFYNYVINPPDRLPEYPFFKARDGTDSMFFAINEPSIYRAEPVTGLLYGFPFAAFSVVTAFVLLRGIPLTRSSGSHPGRQPARDALLWLQIGLFGATLASFAVLLFFFYSSMRYMADTMPYLAILAILGFWLAYHNLSNSRGKMLFILLSSSLAFFSIAASLLLAVSTITKHAP